MLHSLHSKLESLITINNFKYNFCVSYFIDIKKIWIIILYRDMEIFCMTGPDPMDHWILAAELDLD